MMHSERMSRRGEFSATVGYRQFFARKSICQQAQYSSQNFSIRYDCHGEPILVYDRGGQSSSFVEVRKVGCHGLAVFGMAVLFDMSALQSHGLVEDSKTVAPQIDKMICPAAARTWT